jgi:hypothetical protein
MGWVTSCLHLLASLFYGRWDLEKPCGTEWTSDRVLRELFIKLPGPCRPVSSLPCRFLHFFLSLAPCAPNPPTPLWHKICKKVKKKDFLTNHRQFCTFVKVGGRCAARPQRTQTFSCGGKSLRIGGGKSLRIGKGRSLRIFSECVGKISFWNDVSEKHLKFVHS